MRGRNSCKAIISSIIPHIVLFLAALGLALRRHRRNLVPACRRGRAAPCDKASNKSWLVRRVVRPAKLKPTGNHGPSAPKVKAEGVPDHNSQIPQVRHREGGVFPIGRPGNGRWFFSGVSIHGVENANIGVEVPKGNREYYQVIALEDGPPDFRRGSLEADLEAIKRAYMLRADVLEDIKPHSDEGRKMRKVEIVVR